MISDPSLKNEQLIQSEPQSVEEEEKVGEIDLEVLKRNDKACNEYRKRFVNQSVRNQSSTYQ